MISLYCKLAAPKFVNNPFQIYRLPHSFLLVPNVHLPDDSMLLIQQLLCSQLQNLPYVYQHDFLHSKSHVLLLWQTLILHVGALLPDNVDKLLPELRSFTNTFKKQTLHE